ncbi:hypothetical protein BMJ22_14265, partial [Sinorhizobium medicae]
SDRFDVLGRPFLRILREIVRAGERNCTPVTLCGEMASKPLSAMALLGLGFRSVSMSPTAVGPVKAMLLALDAGRLNERLESRTRSVRAVCIWSEIWQSFPLKRCVSWSGGSAKSRRACRPDPRLTST